MRCAIISIDVSPTCILPCLLPYKNFSQLFCIFYLQVKICNPRRSGSGKKKHAAATAQLQKILREEKEKNEATTELDAERKAEDNIRDASFTTSDNHPNASDQESMVNDEKQEKID